MTTITKTQLENASADVQLISDVANGGPTESFVSRLGQEVYSVAKSVATLSAYNPRGAWVTSTSYAIKDIVIQTSIAYMCTIAHTSEIFATDLAAGYWVVHQGATLERLAAEDGDTLIGTQQTGSGSILRTLDQKLAEMPLSPHGYDGADLVSVDNTDRYVEALAAIPHGGTIRFPKGVNYPGALVLAQSGVMIFGQGGCVEEDAPDPVAVGLRPVLTGAGTATVRVGASGSSVQKRRHTLRDLEVSGDDGDGNMADAALMLTNTANSSIFNLGLRDAVRTIDIDPTDGPAVTTLAFAHIGARNDTVITTARTLRVVRSGSDTNYATAVTFAQSHFNGPPYGYLTEQIGSLGTLLSFSQTYFDLKGWAGSFIKDGSGIAGPTGPQYDTGALGVPAIETDSSVTTDPCRFLFGNVRVGGQSIKYRRAVITGSIAGNVLTVTAIAGAGSIVAGDDIHGLGIDHSNGGTDTSGPLINGVAMGSTEITINAFGSGETTGNGGNGTYQLSISQPNLSSRTFYVGPKLIIPDEMHDFTYRQRAMNLHSVGALFFNIAGRDVSEIWSLGLTGLNGALRLRGGEFNVYDGPITTQLYFESQGGYRDKDGNKVVSDRQPNVAKPTGGATTDAECRTALNGVIDLLRTHGLME